MVVVELPFSEVPQEKCLLEGYPREQQSGRTHDYFVFGTRLGRVKQPGPDKNPRQMFCGLYSL